MVQLRVDPAVLVTDAEQLHSIATSLGNGIRSAASSLSSSSGMAGDDNSAEDFAEFYDAEAPKVLTGSGSVVTVLGGLDAAIVSTAGAYKQAEAVGAGKGPGGSEFQPGNPADFSAPSIPSCLGPGLPGALGEFQEVIEDGLAAIGVTIPTGDTGKLRSAAGVWDSLNGDLLSAKSSLSGAFSALQGMDIPQKGDILACQEKLETMLGDLAGNADAMGQACTKFAEGIDNTREELMWMIGQMVAEIMLEIALGAVLGAITGGLGAVAMAAKAATTIARWIQKIAALIMRLRTFIQAQKAWLRGLIKAVGEGAQSAVATVTVQAGVNFARRNDENYQQQSLLTAGMSSFVGSSVSSPVGNRLAGSNPSLARNAFAGGTEGAVDGLASSGVESGMNGTPFNPISAMVLGTLVGAGLRPALGGGGGNAPATTGLGGGTPPVNTPNTPNAPSSPGGGNPGGGSPGGPGNGPSPVDVNSNGPQPGAGAPASPANAGGPSSPVDVDGSNAPQPGAGGAPSSPNAGNGPVDVPSGDVPATPLDMDAPSVDAPSVPDVSAPSVDAPSAPAVDVSAPSVDAPSVAAPAGGVPSVGAPPVDAPSVDAPSVDAPSVDAPSANAPTIDAPTIDAPSVDAPSVDAPPVGSPGAAAPASPETAAPSAPDGLVPDITTPDTTTPLDVDLPPADAPVSPDAGSPDAGSPDAGSVDPSALDPETAAGVAAAAAAGVGIGVGPKLTGLHPGATGGTPSAPAAPASPDAAAPEAGSPDSTAPDPTAPDSTSPDTDAPESTDGTDAGDSSSTDPATPPADGPQGNPPSQLTVDEIRAALDAINPNFDASDPSSEYNNNCGNTSSILNDVLNGAPVTEAGVGTLTVPEMQARTGLPQTPMTPDQIADTLRAMGPGSHCVVGIDRSTGTGHWFNAYFDGTDVHALDAQTGEMMPWPPNEPHATNWDASIDMSAVTPSTTDAQAPSTQAPAAPAAPGVDAPNAADGNGTSPDTDAPDTDAAGDRGNQTQPTSPSHASDGSQGPGTTYNGYDIPELTPEIREQLDALASQPDSPIVRNEDGSYSLAEPITVPDFVRTQPHHDMAEFVRQVGLQQDGLNDLSIAEYQHNRFYYETHGRVAQAEQAAARDLLAQQGHNVDGMDILHGPDQVGGGRADRFDGLGDSGVNRSIGSQWQHRRRDLDDEVDGAILDIDPSLLPHIHMNVQLGATNANPADLPVRRGSVPDDGGAPSPRTGAGSEPSSGRPSIADRLAGLDGPASPRAADPGTPPVGGQAAPAAPASSAGDGGSQPTYGPYRSIADALNGADPISSPAAPTGPPVADAAGAASEAPTNPIRLPASYGDSDSPEAPANSSELPSDAEPSVEAESTPSDAVDAHPAEIAADSDDPRDIHGVVAEPSGGADGPAAEDGPRKLLSDEEFEALDPSQQYEVALREISIGARTFASDAEAHEYGSRHWPVESMTPEQSDAIAGWVMSPRLWNEMARYDRGYDWVRERVAETDAAIRTSTTPERVVVERGTGTDWWTEELGLRLEQLPGHTLNDRGFFGTSLGTAAAGTQPAIMHLSVPAGIPAVYVDGVRGNAEPGERELVMRNVTHRITRVVRTDDGVFHVFGEVLPNE